MMKKKKIKTIILATLVFILLIFLVGIYFNSDKNSLNPTGNVLIRYKEEKPVVKIGIVLPLTGNAAKYGEWAKQGYDLALEEINSNQSYPYLLEPAYEDDRGEPREGVTATQKLINMDKTEVLTGFILSSVALPSASVAEENKVVLISASASADSFKYAGDYIFRLRESSYLHGRKIAEFSFYNLGIRRAAAFYPNAENGISYSEAFKNRFIELGGDIVFYESYEAGSTDFRSSLTKIKEHKPDAVYIPGITPEIGLILKQAKELGLKTQFLSSPGAETPEILEIAGGTADELIYTYPGFNPNCTHNPCKSFVEKYKSKYGEIPGFIPTSSYDIIKILSNIFIKYGVTSDNVKEGLYKMQNYTGAGGVIGFDEYGEIIRDVDIKKIMNNTFISYKS